MGSERAARAGPIPITVILMTVLLIASPHARASSHEPGMAGDLDPAFGSGGIVTTELGSGGGSDVAVQPDGRIVVGGTAGTAFALARYLADGSLDESFGHGGTVKISIGQGASLSAIAIQSNGRIVAAGTAFDGRVDEFALIRVRGNGSQDTGFGEGGSVLTAFPGGGGANDVAIQPDGRIVAAGVASSRFALVRYTPDGSLDPTFGRGGKEAKGPGYAFALAVQPDGKLLAAGSVGGAIALYRYRPDGRFDTTFGDGGRVVTSFGGFLDVEAEDVAVQPNGRIVVAGDALNPGDQRFAMARYRRNGTLDGSFGAGGEVTTGFPDPFIESFATTIALQADGRIVMAGAADTLDRRYFALARYRCNGKPDRSFGANGIVSTDFGMDAEAAGSAIQGDGKIVVAGGYISGFAVARYLSS
jgi:uncharacterized delta-60 repeat protein